MKLIFFVLLIPVSSALFAQSPVNKHSISGHVKDAKTGEELSGAIISVKEVPSLGVGSNAYGFYSITIPEGKYTITATYVGYEPVSVSLLVKANQILDFTLSEKSSELEEVVVTSGKEERLRTTLMGVEKLDMKELIKLPVIGGERDILKTIQLLPGVKSATEGSAGFYVRGGGADQNLILLDEATVYNAAHLMGFFSVFNADALKDVTLYKGNMPAEYGGRLSSVLDVKMKEGNQQQLNVEGGVGLIASRLNVQAPIVRKKGSFFVAARRTYADMFMKLAGGQAAKNQLYFYDINAKTNYRINERDRVFISGYFGRDNLNLSNQYYLKWGNLTGTLRWNHIFSSRLFSNTSLVYSNYNYQVANNPGGNIQYTTSQIQDYSLKQDFQFFMPETGSIKFGLNSIYHIINPVTLTNDQGDKIGNDNLKRFAWENAVYASHEIKVRKLVINYGCRLSSFSIIGPGDFFTANKEGNFTDTVFAKRGELLKTYVNPEPRLGFNYSVNDKTSIKAAYSRTVQNLHMVSASNATEPTDIWIPTSLFIRPEIGDLLSLGYFRSLKEEIFEFSGEVYYKELQNQIGLKDAAQIKGNMNPETELLLGKGRAYGIELLLRKKQGKLTGWISYTLSRTEQQFDRINDGNYFPAKQDRTHDIAIVGIYEASKKWSFSANWIYYTGNAVTFPSGKYEINGQILNYYTERNGYRMPDYHRLDIGATWQRKKTEKYESSWTFSLYNAYGRQNPFFISFRQSESDPSKTEVVQTALFRWIPSFTYNFKFK